MKKLLSIIAIALLGISTTFAQTAVTVPAKQVTKKAKASAVVAKTEVKPACPCAKPAAKPAVKAPVKK